MNHMRPDPLLLSLSRDDGQRSNIDQTVLTVKAYRACVGLLLRKAADAVVERVIDRNFAVQLDREPASLREVSIAHVVLRARAGR